MPASRALTRRLDAFGEVLAQLWTNRKPAHPMASKRQLAREIGLSHSALLKWERGETFNPNARALERLSVAHGLPADRLSAIVRRNQANPNLTFADALAILKGGDPHGQTTTAAGTPPGAQPERWVLDRRTAGSLLKTAHALVDQLHRAFGEQTPGPRVAAAKRPPRARGRGRSTATGA
jgi:transcriptional regulator with XRE-family HTH domain